MAARPLLLILVIAALFVVGLVVAIVVLLMSLRPRRDDQRADAPAPRSSSGLRLAFLALGFIVALVAIPALLFIPLSMTHDTVQRQDQSLARELRRASGDAAVPRAVRELSATERSRSGEQVEFATGVKGATGPALPSLTPMIENGRVVLRLTDDFEGWKRSFVGYEEWEVTAPSRDTPGWVVNAGGTKYEQREDPRRLVVVSRIPGAAGVLVGFSTQLEPTPADARRAAVDSAVRQLAASVVWAARDARIDGKRIELPEAISHAEVVAARAFDDLLRDEYAVGARGAAGTSYRSAVLVDAGPQTIDKLAQTLAVEISNEAAERSRERARLGSNIFSALGLALCVFLIYCFLNAGTKGHFAWPLRIISIGALALIYALAILS